MNRPFRLAQLVLAIALAAPMLGACGSDEGPAPAPAPAPSISNSSLTGASPASSAARNSAAPCVDRQVRECRIELGQQGTVQNCFVGLELCANGAWGSCLNSDEIEAQLNAQ
jgi:hypothetical protein